MSVPLRVGTTAAASTEGARAGGAHAFFWTELCAAAGVSILGNATQAVLHTTFLPAVAAAVAVIPPLALLASVHGVALLTRAHPVSSTARRTATALTVVIAGAAFWMSFTALRALAITAGVPVAEAWLWPLIVEGSMTQSTIALLTLAHTHRPGVNPNPYISEPDPLPQPRAHTTPDTHADPPAPAAEPPDHSRADPAAPTLDLTELAKMICDQDPGGRRDPATVTSILTLRHVDEWSASRIAREVGCSRSAVSRILRDAERLRAHGTTERAHPGVRLLRDRAHADRDSSDLDVGRAHAEETLVGCARAEIGRTQANLSQTD
ncbi:DUF2637 domain-containing protein [Nocardia sp. NPDC055029]